MVGVGRRTKTCSASECLALDAGADFPLLLLLHFSVLLLKIPFLDGIGWGCLGAFLGSFRSLWVETIGCYHDLAMVYDGLSPVIRRSRTPQPADESQSKESNIPSHEHMNRVMSATPRADRPGVFDHPQNSITPLVLIPRYLG
jgi:hypothetical protein